MLDIVDRGRAQFHHVLRRSGCGKSPGERHGGKKAAAFPHADNRSHEISRRIVDIECERPLGHRFSYDLLLLSPPNFRLIFHSVFTRGTIFGAAAFVKQMR
jgi:hypothetical protein